MELNETEIESEKNKMRKKLLFWGLVFLLPGWILWRSVFPTGHYFFNRSVGNGLRMVEKEIDGRRFVLVPLENDGLIDALEITASFEQAEDPEETFSGEKKLSVAKNYEVSLYPWGEEISDIEKLKKIIFFNNNTNFPNGVLLADERAVYAVSAGQLRPFLSPEAFERLGYRWEKIVSNKSLPTMPLGDTINLQASHPEGTIFKVADGNFFIFFQGQKRWVSEVLLKEVWPDFFWVEIGNAEPTYFNSCLVDDSSTDLSANFDCQFSLGQEKGTSNIFIVALDGLKNQKIEDFQLTTSTSVFLNPKRNLGLFVKKIRDRLSTQYGFLKKL